MYENFIKDSSGQYTLQSECLSFKRAVTYVKRCLAFATARFNGRIKSPKNIGLALYSDKIECNSNHPNATQEHKYERLKRFVYSQEGWDARF